MWACECVSNNAFSVCSMRNLWNMLPVKTLKPFIHSFGRNRFKRWSILILSCRIVSCWQLLSFYCFCVYCSCAMCPCIAHSAPHSSVMTLLWIIFYEILSFLCFYGVSIRLFSSTLQSKMHETLQIVKSIELIVQNKCMLHCCCDWSNSFVFKYLSEKYKIHIIWYLYATLYSINNRFYQEYSTASQMSM